MFQLSSKSKAALDEFCETLGENQASFLREVVDKIAADPWGKRHPQHNFTRRFHTPEAYVDVKLPEGVQVGELKTTSFRALFLTQTVEKQGRSHGFIIFLPVNGKRFFSFEDAPWPH